MCWALTYVHEENDQNIVPGYYVTKSKLGPGIRCLGFSTTWFVPVSIIQQMALAENKSPVCLAAEQIRRYIMEYYKCAQAPPTSSVSTHTETL